MDERLLRGLGSHARPSTPLGTHVARFGPLEHRAQTARHALRSARATPTRALRPDAFSALVGLGVWATSEHPPALARHMRACVWALVARGRGLAGGPTARVGAGREGMNPSIRRRPTHVRLCGTRGVGRIDRSINSPNG